jgi:hypothetical protein
MSLINDIKRKLPWYLSDFRDGLNFQCLSSILFMYLGCLTTSILYGGKLETNFSTHKKSLFKLDFKFFIK